MGKQQVNTGKESQTVNTNNVWDRIVALENNGVPNLSGELNGVKSQLAQMATKEEVRLKTVKIGQTDVTEEFLQQMAGNTPINSVPADYSLTEKKFAVPILIGTPSKNLFNKNDIESGKYIVQDNGGTFDIGGFFTSNYISVEPSTAYYLYANDWQRRIAFYQSDKTFISYLDGVNAITTPVNTAYIRFCSNNTDLGIAQLEKNAIYTSYEKFGTKIGAESINAKLAPKRLIDIISKIVLSSETVNIKLIGDSITHGVGGSNFNMDGEQIVSGWNVNTGGVCWANMLKVYLQSKFNCTVTNYGCSGTTSKFIIDNFNTLVKSTDDIVICMIGTNDRNYNTTMKQVYYDNLRTIYSLCTENGKEVIFMSSIPASVADETDVNNPKDYHMEDVDYLVMKLASDLNIEYISLYKEFMDYCNMKSVTIDSLLSDGLHPNDNGYTIMFNVICDRLGIGRKRPNATW